jgi:hypothetical protein
MNSRMRCERGFALVFVIVILGLIGTYMMVLARDANTIVFQTERAYLEACSVNMVASGGAWARQNIDGAAGDVELDTSAFGVQDSLLSVGATGDGSGGKRVEVRSECGRLELDVHRGDSFMIRGAEWSRAARRRMGGRGLEPLTSCVSS